MEKEQAGEYVQFAINFAGHEFTDVLGIPIVHGRDLNEAEITGALVNEAFALDMWGRTDVAGEVFDESIIDEDRTDIVGVVADTHYGHPSEAVVPRMYFYMTPLSLYEFIVVETAMSATDLRAALQRAIDEGALEIELADVERLSDVVGEVVVADRARSLLAVVTAIVVVALAAFGFYGTQRYLVAAGRREYAILSALGAGPAALGRLVFKRSFLMGVPGLVFGAVLAFIAIVLMQDGFLSRDISPLAIAASASAGVLGLVLAATLGPARLARTTDPGPLLKQE